MNVSTTQDKNDEKKRDERQCFVLRLHPNRAKAKAARGLYEAGYTGVQVALSYISSWDYWVRLYSGVCLPATAPDALREALQAGGLLENWAELALDHGNMLIARVYVRGLNSVATEVATHPEEGRLSYDKHIAKLLPN